MLSPVISLMEAKERLGVIREKQSKIMMERSTDWMGYTNFFSIMAPFAFCFDAIRVPRMKFVDKSFSFVV